MLTEIETVADRETRYAALALGDLDAIYAIHRAAISAVNRPELVKPESPDFFRRMLTGSGRIVGAMQAGQLVAYGVLQLDLPPSEDARPLLGLAPSDGLAKLAGAAVLPTAWGAGLHGAIIERRIAEARRIGLSNLYSTSAPGNARSWTNLLDAGFAICGIVEKYGGHLRYLLYRDFSRAGPPGNDIWCPAADIPLQRQLLNDVRVGIAWRRNPDGERDLCFRSAA